MTTVKEDDGFENVTVGEAVMIEIQNAELSKSELKNLILDRVNLRLTLEWYKEWFSLLTDPLHTRRRGERETLWPIISDHLPEEDRKELKAKQRTAEKEWERLQSQTLPFAQIDKLHKSCFGSSRSNTTAQRSSHRDDYLKEMTCAMNQILEVQGHLEDLKQEITQLQSQSYVEKLEKRLSIATSEKEEALTRLSQIAGNKLKHNNADIADLSDRNRPTCLAEKFSELYDNEWTDAYDHVNKSCDQESTIAHLVDLLQKVNQECSLYAVSQRNNLHNALQISNHIKIEEQDTETKDVHKRQTDAEMDISRKIIDLQISSAELSISRVKKRLKSTLQTDMSPVEDNDKRLPYIDKCVELCWYMNIQERPVVIDFDYQKGDKFRTDVHRHYTKTGSTCDFLVWPPMFLYDGGPLLQKGVMQPM